MQNPAQRIIQSAVIDMIKKRHKLKYCQIAEKLGVHNSHIQKVSKGERLLSEKKFAELCEIWHVDVGDLSKKLELDEQEYQRLKTIEKLLEIRQLDIKDLSAKTGISVLKLHQIEERRQNLTSEEARKIAAFFDVDAAIISEDRIAATFAMVEKLLEYIYISPSSIEAVMDFLELELS